MSVADASAGHGFRGVLVAAVATAFGALPLLLGFGESIFPTGALYGAGWVAFGVAAALVFDRGAERRVGGALAMLALVSAAVAVVALPSGRGQVWGRLEAIWAAVDIVAVLVTLVVLAGAMGYAPGRTARRRLFWLLVCSALVFGAVVTADAVLDARAVAVVMTLGLWSLAGLVTRLTSSTDLRPVDEPLVDVAAALLPLAIGAAVGVVMRLAGTRAGIPAPDLAAAFAALTGTALAWPAAASGRRSWLARRYGTGSLTAADVASITAGLHDLAEPRELLARAADMVGASSGQRRVVLVLGEESPETPTGWVDHPLLVGGDRVGTLLLDPDNPQGPEPRQAAMVGQLLPTVALICRAVGLAVEADQARQDVARERDAERSRILADLHDGLGPVLAGMSMRVQAELRRRPSPLLESLAPELAEARADLRRIVAGLTPSALHDHGLAGALKRLIATFDGDGRGVRLEFSVEAPLREELTVAIYRSVAEGVTNAFRHGRASQVAVRVGTTESGQIVVDVRDNGVGGPIVPGIGLSSLRQRAEQLGGQLAVGPHDGGGILLHVELPTETAA